MMCNTFLTYAIGNEPNKMWGQMIEFILFLTISIVNRWIHYWICVVFDHTYESTNLMVNILNL